MDRKCTSIHNFMKELYERSLKSLKEAKFPSTFGMSVCNCQRVSPLRIQEGEGYGIHPPKHAKSADSPSFLPLSLAKPLQPLCRRTVQWMQTDRRCRRNSAGCIPPFQVPVTCDVLSPYWIQCYDMIVYFGTLFRACNLQARCSCNRPN